MERLAKDWVKIPEEAASETETGAETGSEAPKQVNREGAQGRVPEKLDPKSKARLCEHTLNEHWFFRFGLQHRCRDTVARLAQVSG